MWHETNIKKYWFKRRRYGWGWTPVTLQGWLMVIVLAGVAAGTAYAVLPLDSQQPNGAQMGVFIGGLAVYILAIVIVSVTKGPLPHWRWGKKSTDDPDEDY